MLAPMTFARPRDRPETLADWNVVATVQSRAFVEACRTLEAFGTVARTGYYNVLVMKVADPRLLLETIAARRRDLPSLLDSIGRLVPLTCCFDFETPDQFRTAAKSCALGFLAGLEGKSFHVRLHRRGLRGVLSSPDEERLLAEALLAALAERGTPGRISFDDPDAVVVVESVDTRAGLAIFTREDLARYPFFKPE